VKKIIGSLNDIVVGHVISMLEQADIPYTVRNQYLSGAFGELPATECWPEVWINNDEDYETALTIVREATAEISDAGPWHCTCGEDNEGQFASCWKCGEERDSGFGTRDS